MRKALPVIALGVLLAQAGVAAAEVGDSATAASSPLSQAQSAVLAAISAERTIPEKAVPRKDKDAIELIGTVVDGYTVTDPCSGTPIVVLWVRSTAAPLNPVGAGCAGSSFVGCAALRIGQRVRLQGLLLTLPDPTTPGFDACDQSTWFRPAVPIETFLVTKVLK